MDTSIWFENRPTNKIPSRLQVLTSSQPALRPRILFTQTSWATDIVVLYHNGIRYEIQDLFIALRSMAQRLDVLQVTDCRVLSKWLEQFGQMVALYFTVCAKVMYPKLLNGHVSLTCRDVRKRTKSLVDELVGIYNVSIQFGDRVQERDDVKVVGFDSAVLQQSLEKLALSVFAFVANLGRFFTWEKEIVSGIVGEMMNRKDMRQLEIQMLEEMMNYDMGEGIYGAFSRLIPEEVKDLYVEEIGRYKALRMRRKERKWQKEHRALLANFM